MTGSHDTRSDLTDHAQGLLGWSFVQFHADDGPVVRGALLGGGRDTVVELPHGLPGNTVLDLLREWPTVVDTLRTWSPEDGSEVTGAKLLTPLTYPGTVLGAGANYHGDWPVRRHPVPNQSGYPARLGGRSRGGDRHGSRGTCPRTGRGSTWRAT